MLQFLFHNLPFSDYDSILFVQRFDRSKFVILLMRLEYGLGEPQSRVDSMAFKDWKVTFKLFALLSQRNS